ncbi:hypothetical protein BURCENBC7_AP1983 [Burkholderia cenocepacia BC7]|nr:hypothetical protein BURCENBC7_AP1983 [Burkholderia cenocepacia BC7]
MRCRARVVPPVAIPGETRAMRQAAGVATSREPARIRVAPAGSTRGCRRTIL